MTVSFQMFGNVALIQRPKVAFLSSRKVAPAAVMRCYDWATGMRGGGGTPGGSAGRLAPPGDVGHAGCVTLPQRARRPLSQCAAKMAAFPVSAPLAACLDAKAQYLHQEPDDPFGANDVIVRCELGTGYC